MPESLLLFRIKATLYSNHTYSKYNKKNKQDGTLSKFLYDKNDVHL